MVHSYPEIVLHSRFHGACGWAAERDALLAKKPFPSRRLLAYLENNGKNKWRHFGEIFRCLAWRKVESVSGHVIPKFSVSASKLPCQRSFTALFPARLSGNLAKKSLRLSAQWPTWLNVKITARRKNIACWLHQLNSWQQLKTRQIDSDLD